DPYSDATQFGGVTGVVIQDTPSAPKTKPVASKLKLKGVQYLTPEEQEAAEIMQALKESKKTSRRQPNTRGSIEVTGRIPGVFDEFTVVSATSSEGTKNESEHSEDSQLNSDEEEKKDNDGDADDEDEDGDHITDIQDTDDEDAKTESNEDEIYNLSVSFGFGTHFLNLSFDVSLTGVLKDSAEAKISSLIIVISNKKLHISISIALSPPHVTPTISIVQQTTTPIPSPSITTEAPTITTTVPEFDALTAIQLRSASKIRKIKKEQVEKQKMSKYTIKSTNKAALKEYDLKSALYQTMNENKSFNRNPANHALYHALMKALIEDENDMDKGVVDIVKNHKRKHDDDKDDDEDPSTGLNQGKKTKRRRTKELESSMKPSTMK
ncbi:hypothetical protein Tco_1323537, partial [Tanacetum coccineum]